ncbi:uncharacterized protein LOC112618115 [Theropithecus gelada]|uniref:uncharacterized protein LOC112618115 n=1 Tax=Theropithecus gelada TaxID=9565 RepID=UPI000DC1B85D|nr:uncharacterized protein LOC112618115 [Theropithecus gelada]
MSGKAAPQAPAHGDPVSAAERLARARGDELRPQQCASRVIDAGGAAWRERCQRFAGTRAGPVPSPPRRGRVETAASNPSPTEAKDPQLLWLTKNKASGPGYTVPNADCATAVYCMFPVLYTGRGSSQNSVTS